MAKENASRRLLSLLYDVTDDDLNNMSDAEVEFELKAAGIDRARVERAFGRFVSKTMARRRSTKTASP